MHVSSYAPSAPADRSAPELDGVVPAAAAELSGAVSAIELRTLIESGAIVLDVRHDRLRGSQRDTYALGHIPGAIFVELRTELAGPRTGTNGNNPLPEPAALAESLERWGIDGSRPVVVYGDRGTPAPGRAWWVLRWAGVPDVRILEGGYDAWIEFGGDIENGSAVEADGVAETGDGGGAGADVDGAFRGGVRGSDRSISDEVGGSLSGPVGDAMRVLSADEAARFAAEGRLLDLRDAELTIARPEDPDSGHIPGAINLPYHELFADDGTFAAPEQLEAVLRRSGVDRSRGPIGLTCGGGVAASLGAFALTALGYETAVHIGSWSEWISDPSRPRAESSG